MFGGTNATGAADDTVHTIDLENSPPTWRRFARKGFTLANHTALNSLPVFARVPEIYRENTPGDNNDWARLESSTLLQDWYPFNFLVPGAGGDSSRIFSAGPDNQSRYLTAAHTGGATAWNRFPSDTAGVYGWRFGSAVQYRPGKIMRCGLRDTHTPGTGAVATTQYIEVTSAAPQWNASANMASSRVYHNLVILPTGEVLATGGMGTVSNDHDLNPRQRPATRSSWRIATRRAHPAGSPLRSAARAESGPAGRARPRRRRGGSSRCARTDRIPSGGRPPSSSCCRIRRPRGSTCSTCRAGGFGRW